MTGIDDLPIRDELRGKSPYGAPAARRPRTAEHQREPLPAARAAGRADRRAGRARPPATLNRYPDRDAVELRTELAALPHADRRLRGRPRPNVWAANGSNEVLQQLLQTFGGPGRTAIGFEPSYSMHALIARGTGTGWISGPRNEDFTIDLAAAVQRHRRAPARRRLHHLAQQPHRHRGRRRDRARAVRGRAGGQAVAWSWSTRRTSSSATAPRCCRCSRAGRTWWSRRTMSKAFGAAGLRLGYLAARPGRRRRRPAGAAAVPPVGRHPGHRAGRAGAHRYAARVRRAAEGRAGPAGRASCAPSAARSPSPTPTSCSSAASRTPTTRLAGRSSTAASWSGTTAYRAGCG